MTLAIPASSSRSVWSSALAGDRSKPRASRSGDSSSKSHRGRRGNGASATAQALTTWLDNVVGFAPGWPGTEIPYSISVPITRRTLMRLRLGVGTDTEAGIVTGAGTGADGAARRPGRRRDRYRVTTALPRIS